MGIKGKAVKSREDKKTNRTRPRRNAKAKARGQSSWLTVLSDDGETSESEDADVPRPQSLPIRRK